MPAPFLDVDFHPPLPVLSSGFFRLADNVQVRSLKEPLKRCIQEVAAPAFRENFASNGRGNWEPLADSTLETTKRKGDPGTLVKTGKLRKAAGRLNIWTIDGARGEARVDPENLDAVGVGYGVVHQVGTDVVPQREWAFITADDMDKMQQVFGTWVGERIMRDLGVARA